MNDDGYMVLSLLLHHYNINTPRRYLLQLLTMKKKEVENRLSYTGLEEYWKLDVKTLI